MTGWVSFFAGFSAPIAAAALAFADYLGYFFPALKQANATCRFKTLFRITGNGVEAPVLLSVFRVVGGDIAAHSVLRACVADDYLIFRDAWRRSDGKGLGRVGGLDAPHWDSAALVEQIGRAHV